MKTGGGGMPPPAEGRFPGERVYYFGLDEECVLSMFGELGEGGDSCDLVDLN